MKDKFQIIDFLDNCRWNKKDNYSLINYFTPKISNDLKLLTHWICYITDRQMKFEQIWDVGGYVFSEMLYEYGNRGIDVLKIGGDFFARKNDGYAFTSKSTISNNKKILEYGKKIGERVEFVSRFYPADYICMYYTLHTLQEFQKSFTQYIIKILKLIKNPSDEKDLIHGLAYGLYILTYSDVGQIKKEQLETENWEKKAKARTNIIVKLLDDKREYDKKVKEFFESSNCYKIKRVWCSLRDYIKSEEFGKNCLKIELKRHGVTENIIKKLYSKEAKKYLELPGDVWNNNPKFRKCLFEERKCENSDDQLQFNRLLRKIYEEEKITCGYPEQFDVTFDFVPRMCEKNNCDICPFSALKKKNNILKICANNLNKYCTVALNCCGYKAMCKGEKCELRKLIKK